MGIQSYLQKYKECFDDSPLAVLIVNVVRDGQGKPCDFHICYANSSLSKVTQTPLEVLTSKDFSRIFFNAEDIWAKFYANVSDKNIVDNICALSPEIDKYINIQAYKIFDDYCLGIMTDVTEEKTKENQYLSRASEADFLSMLLQNTSGGIYMTDIAQYNKVQYANDKYYQLYGYTKEQFDKELSGDVTKIILPEDFEKITKILDEHKNGFEGNIVVEYKAKKRNGETAYYRNSITVSKVNAIYTMAGILIDITEEKLAFRIIERQNKEITRIYNAVPGGIFSCKYDEYWTVISANDAFFKFLGYTREEFKTKFKNRMLGVIYKDDVEPMYSIVSTQLQTAASIKNVNRLVCKNGEVKWISIHAELIENEENEKCFYCVFVDITEQKNVEQELLESEEKNKIALRSSKLLIWTYNLKNQKITTEYKQANGGYKTMIIENGYRAIVDKGFVMPDSIGEYIRLHKDIENGAETATAIIHFNAEKMKVEWQKITYTNVFDKNGKPSIAIASGEDITDFVKMQNKYKSELIYHEEINDIGLLAKVKINVTQNNIESYVATPNASCGATAGDSFTELVEIAVSGAVTQQQKEEIEKVFNRNTVLEKFSGGTTEFKVEYQRILNDGTRLWTLTTIKCFLDIETSDVFGFWYSRDVNERKMSQIIVDKISATEYELLALLDIEGDSLSIHRSRDDDKKYTSGKKLEYSQNLSLLFPDCKIEEGLEKCKQALSIDKIIYELDNKAEYSCAFTIVSKNGEKSRKKWQMCYLDSSKETLLISRSDITDFYQKELNQMEKLKKALELAEQANVAKSGFLSRMSHEIRTPMNVILGMTAIAQKNADNTDELKEYLEKINISAKFLLSLINDILDMSRIESGKIAVNCDKIYFNEFIKGINTICKEQASNNGVIYTSIVEGFDQKVYIGDGTKLQQVLINVISNAIKFTNQGGTVQFLVQKTEDDVSNKEKLKFIISDTGIGINNKDLERIFLTFEQINTSATTIYGGTGLGLAISKNLIELMGGSISVTSIEGIGSEFVVQIELAKFQNQMQGISSCNQSTSVNQEFDFCCKRILLVEDHILNVEIAKKLLECKNVTVDIAENGLVATQMFKQNSDYYYDAILMDVRMPVMDGITATKVIRNSSKEDAKTIPIIAMSANAFDEDIEKSKKSGMNAHLAKPIEPNDLYKTLASFL